VRQIHAAVVMEQADIWHLAIVINEGGKVVCKNS
jgi:stalled ribosome rescue protein Dom34